MPAAVRSSSLVFMARNSSLITSWVLELSFLAHPLDRAGELIGLCEDVGVFGKEAEDQPRHEVVHVVAARAVPHSGLSFRQLDIEPVQTAGRLDVKGALADLLDGADPAKGKKKPK